MLAAFGPAADRLSVGFAAFTFDESFGKFALHQALVFIGPWGSLVLAAVGFELRRSR